jgi:hypothetical protein
MMAEPMETDRPDFLEQHYTIAQLAEAWHMSTRMLRKWFANEPGVIKFGVGKLTKNRKRAYVSLRIPESVARRVYQQNAYRRTGR